MPLEVFLGHHQFAELVDNHLIADRVGVDVPKLLQEATHRAMQAAMHGPEVLEALLDEHRGGADGRVARHLVVLIERRADHAASRVNEEAQQLEQHGRRRRERQRHIRLADVVHRKRALHLGGLTHLRPDVLAAGRSATLQLDSGLAVAQERRVKQRTQRARRGTGQRSNHLRHADGDAAAPRPKQPLDEEVEALLVLVALLPVAVDREDAARVDVDGHDVGQHAVFVAVLKRGQHGRHFVDHAHVVHVLGGRLAANDAVVGHRALGLVIDARGRLDVQHVEPEAAPDVVVELVLVDVLLMREARLAVEVAVAPRAVDLVDGDEHDVGVAVDRVRLRVERAAQRALREAHLELMVGRGHHLGDLVVHVARGALGAVFLLVARVSDHVALHRAFGG